MAEEIFEVQTETQPTGDEKKAAERLALFSTVLKETDPVRYSGLDENGLKEYLSRTPDNVRRIRKALEFSDRFENLPDNDEDFMVLLQGGEIPEKKQQPQETTPVAEEQGAQVQPEPQVQPQGELSQFNIFNKYGKRKTFLEELQNKQRTIEEKPEPEALKNEPQFGQPSVFNQFGQRGNFLENLQEKNRGIVKPESKVQNKAESEEGAADMSNKKIPAVPNNNPGNIMYGDFAIKMGATGKKNNGIAIFPDFDSGSKAQHNLLSGKRYGDMPLKDIPSVWAPKGHGNNNPIRYSKQLKQITGFDEDTLAKSYKSLTPEQQDSFRKAMIQVEHGVVIPKSQPKNTLPQQIELTGEPQTGEFRAEIVNGKKVYMPQGITAGGEEFIDEGTDVNKDPTGQYQSTGVLQRDKGQTLYEGLQNIVTGTPENKQGLAFNSAQQKRNDERGFIDKGKDFVATQYAGAKRIAGFLWEGLKNTAVGFSAGLPTPQLDDNIQNERIKSNQESNLEIVKKSKEIGEAFQKEAVKRNIETSVLNALENGNYNRIPEAAAYTMGDMAMQIVPAMFTGGTSMYFQTLPDTYTEGVEQIAREKGISVEDVIKSGQDGKLIAMSSAGLQGWMEQWGAGRISNAIATKGGYKAVRDWMLKNSKNKTLAKLAGISFVAAGGAATETGQEMTTVTGGILAKSKDAVDFTKKFSKEFWSPENQKRYAENAIAGALGEGGLAAAGRGINQAKIGFEKPIIATAPQQGGFDAVILADQINNGKTPDVKAVIGAKKYVDAQLSEQGDQASEELKNTAATLDKYVQTNVNQTVTNMMPGVGGQQQVQDEIDGQPGSEEVEIGTDEWVKYLNDHKLSDERFQGMVDDVIEGRDITQFGDRYMTMYGMYKEQIEEAANQIKQAMGEEAGTDIENPTTLAADEEASSLGTQTGAEITNETGGEVVQPGITPVVTQPGMPVVEGQRNEGQVPVDNVEVEGEGVVQPEAIELGFIKISDKELAELPPFQKGKLIKGVDSRLSELGLVEGDKVVNSYDGKVYTVKPLNVKNKSNFEQFELTDSNGAVTVESERPIFQKVEGPKAATPKAGSVEGGENPILKKLGEDVGFITRKFSNEVFKQIGLPTGGEGGALTSWKGTEFTASEFKNSKLYKDNKDKIDSYLKEDNINNIDEVDGFQLIPTFFDGKPRVQIGVRHNGKVWSHGSMGVNVTDIAYKLGKEYLEVRNKYDEEIKKINKPELKEGEPAKKKAEAPKAEEELKPNQRVLTDKEVQDRIKAYEQDYTSPMGHTVEGGLLKWFKDRFGEDSDEYKKELAKLDKLKSGEPISVTFVSPLDLINKPISEMTPVEKDVNDLFRGVGKGIRDSQNVGAGKNLGQVDQEKKDKKAAEKQEIRAERDTELDAKKKAILERMSKRQGGKLNTGIDPEDLADALEFMGLSIEGGAYKISDIVKDAAELLGEMTDKMLRAIKAGYNAYRGDENTSDDIADQMDDEKTVRNFKLENKQEENTSVGPAKNLNLSGIFINVTGHKGIAGVAAGQGIDFQNFFPFYMYRNDADSREQYFDEKGAEYQQLTKAKVNQIQAINFKNLKDALRESIQQKYYNPGLRFYSYLETFKDFLELVNTPVANDILEYINPVYEALLAVDKRSSINKEDTNEKSRVESEIDRRMQVMIKDLDLSPLKNIDLYGESKNKKLKQPSVSEESDNDLTVEDIEFMAALRRRMNHGEKVGIVAMRKMYPGVEDTDLQELAELLLVRMSRDAAKKAGEDTATGLVEIEKIYDVQPTISMRSSQRIELQQYSTPIPFAYLASDFVASAKPELSLEPNAGNGALTISLNPKNVVVNEIDKSRLKSLNSQGFKEITTQDALEPFGKKKYDAIVMNPPFGSSPEVTVDGYKIQGLDPKMIVNALNAMKDDGVAALIMGGHNKYDDQNRLSTNRTFFNYLYNNYNVLDVINVDGPLYAKQGTSFPTRLILIAGRKSNPEGAAPLKSEEKNAVVTNYTDLKNRIQNAKDFVLQSKLDAKRNGGQSNDGGTNQGTKGKPEETERPNSISQGTVSPISQGGNRPGGATGSQSGGSSSTQSGGRPTGQQPGGSSGQSSQSGSNAGSNKPVSGSELGERRNTAGTQQGGSQADIQRNQPDRDLRESDVDITQDKTEYVSASGGRAVGTVQPTAQAAETRRVLQEIQGRVGNIDEFITKELDYPNKEELYKSLSAEQIDAVAMAIDQFNRNSGIIIGDMTGVGKGRIAAAMLRFAHLKGMKPVFLTEKSDLFSDMYRDLKAVGSAKMVPFIFNNDPKAKITEEKPDGTLETIYKLTPTEAFRAGIEAQGMPQGYDYAMATYSQFNSPRAAQKRELMQLFSNGSLLIMDESHNSSGPESNIGTYLRGVVSNSKSTVFLSATFAKRPDNMPIYGLKTSIQDAGLSNEDLIYAIKRGGVPLQEIISTQLVESGQMIRREREFEGVEMNFTTLDDPKTEKDHRQKADAVIQIFRDIIEFQKLFVAPAIERLDEEAAAEGERMGITAGTSEAGVSNTPFASKIFNAVSQLLFALKAEDVAREAVTELKSGRKVVIGFQNTMESFFNDMGYTDGDVIANLDFSQSLIRGLRATLRYTKTDAMGVKIPGELTPEQLGVFGKVAYYGLMRKIEKASSGILLSPIDAMTKIIEDAGFSVGEITGRKNKLRIHDDGSATLEKRQEKNKKTIVAKFNNGQMDAVMLNSSGSTGISMHASETVSDQRQRVMLIVQAPLDVNTFIQMMGRIDRTGQVVRGAYNIISSSIPAEKRLAMMLARKVKSLFANSSGKQKAGSVNIDVVDFTNKYGDEIMTQYLAENPTINERILDPLRISGMTEEDVITNSYSVEDGADKALRKVALLLSGEQDKFYKEVTERYEAYMDYLNSNDANDLEVKILPLNAKTISTTVLQEGAGTNSPFGQSAFLNKMEVAVLKKPLPSVQVEKRINEVLDGLTPEEFSRNLIDEIEKYYDSRVESTEAENAKALNEKIDKERKGIEADREIDEVFGDGAAQERQSRIQAITEALKEEYDVRNQQAAERNSRVKVQLASRARQFKVGSMYEVPIDVDVKPETPTVRGVLIDFKVNKKASNPYAPSNITLLFATQDSRQLVKIPASKERFLTQAYLKSQSKGISKFEGSKEEWDKKQSAVSNTEIRYIVTGNILMGYGVRPGQLITFTTDTGKIKKGILYSKDFIGEGDNALKTRIPISRALPVINRSRQGLVTTNGDMMLRPSNQGYSISVTSTRLRGGKYFLDPVLRSFVEGENFRQVSDRMVGTITSEKIQQALDYLSSNFNLMVESDEVAKPIEQSFSDRAINIIDKAIDDINTGTFGTVIPGVPQLVKEALKIFRAAIVVAKQYGPLTAKAVRDAKKKAIDWIKEQTEKTDEAIKEATKQFEKITTPINPKEISSKVVKAITELETDIMNQVSNVVNEKIGRATTEEGIKAGRNEVKNVLRTIFSGMKTKLTSGQLNTIMAKVPKTNSLKALANFIYTAANVVHQGEMHDNLEGIKKAILKIMNGPFVTKQDKDALVPLIKALNVNDLKGDAISEFADIMKELGSTRLGKEFRETSRNDIASWLKNQIDNAAEAKELIRERLLQERYEREKEDNNIPDTMTLDEFKQYLEGRANLRNEGRKAQASINNANVKAELQDVIPLLFLMAKEAFYTGPWGSTPIVGKALESASKLKLDYLSIPELRHLQNILADYVDTGDFSNLGVFAATADAEKAVKEIAPYASEFRTMDGKLVKKNFANLSGSMARTQNAANKLREVIFQRAQMNFVKTIRKTQGAIKEIEDFAAKNKFTERQIRTVEVFNILKQAYTQGNTWQEWRDRMIDQYEKYAEVKRGEARDIKTLDWKSWFKNAYEDQVRNAEETIETLQSFDGDDLESGLSPEQLEYHRLIVDKYRSELPAFKESSMAYYGIEIPEGNNNYVPLNPIYRFKSDGTNGKGDILDVEDFNADITSRPLDLVQINKSEAGTSIERTPFVNNDVVYGTDLIHNFSKRFYETAYQNQLSHDLFVMAKLLNSDRFTDVISIPGSTVNSDALMTMMKGIVASERLSGFMAVDRRSFLKKLSGGSLASVIVGVWQLPKQSVGVFPMVARVPGKIFGKAFKMGAAPTEAMRKFLDNTTLLLRTDYQSESDISKRHRQMNEFAGKSLPVRLFRNVKEKQEAIADLGAKNLVARADRFVSRAALIAGYMYSLEKQGIDISNIDWEVEAENPNMEALAAGENLSEIINNTSDQTSKAEVLKTQKSDTATENAREANWMLASFDLNAFQDLYNNWRTLTNQESTGDQRKEAFVNLTSQFINSFLYQSVSLIQRLAEGAAIEMALGALMKGEYEPPDEEEFWRIFKNQLWIKGIMGPFSLLTGGVGNFAKIIYRYGANLGFSVFQDEESTEENKGTIWNPLNGLFYDPKEVPLLEMTTRIPETVSRATSGSSKDEDKNQIMLAATLASFFLRMSDPERITNKVLRETEKSEKRRDKLIKNIKNLDKNPEERKAMETKMWEYLKEGKESSADRLLKTVQGEDPEAVLDDLFNHAVDDKVKSKYGILDNDEMDYLNLAYGNVSDAILTVKYPKSKTGTAKKLYSDHVFDGNIKPEYLQTIRKKYEEQAKEQKANIDFLIKHYPDYSKALKQYTSEGGKFEPLADKAKRGYISNSK